MEHHQPVHEVPLSLADAEPKSPHHVFSTPEEGDPLRQSIRRFDVMSALIACDDGHGRYLIIDGRRRYRIARELGLGQFWCVVHPPMESGERERLRFELQTTFKPLTQREGVKERDLGIRFDV